MHKPAFLFLLSGLCLSLFAQPDTEILLFDMTKEGTSITLSNAQNISNNPGYDNQPYFLADGTGLLYSSNLSGQTEVYHYDLEEGVKTQLTTSDGSEYSPTPLSDGSGFSCILLEPDGTQLLWKYPFREGEPELLIPELKVGYHCWLPSNQIAAFVLGEPHELVLAQAKSPDYKLIATNPGRTLHWSDREAALYFSITDSSEIHSIQKWKPGQKRTTAIFDMPQGSQDFELLADGTLICGMNETLLYFDTIKRGWLACRMSESIKKGKISRIAANEAMTKIALVMEYDQN